MSATIDNLGADRRVRVIEGFIDARGRTCAAGAEGLITHLGLDTTTMEIFIDWAPDGLPPERLVFLLASSEGPGNGRMRRYFEVVDRIDLRPAPPPPPPTEPAPRAIQRPDMDLSPLGGAQPQADVCLHDIAVACMCDPAFHRPLIPAGQLGAHACLRCGAVTVTRMVGDDGRFTGDAWTAYWAIPTPQSIVDWLAHFPRVKIDYAGAPRRWPMSAALVRWPTLYYPAALRLDDVALLATRERELTEAQAGRPVALILRDALEGLPDPPTALGPELSGFATLQRTARLAANASVETLLAHAHPGLPGGALAVDALTRRHDAFEIMAAALGATDDDRFMAGVAMARDWPGDDPRMAKLMIATLDGLSLAPLKDVPGRIEHCLRVEALLVAIADCRLTAPDMLTDLAARQRTLASRDRYTAEYIGITLNELRAGMSNEGAPLARPGAAD